MSTARQLYTRFCLFLVWPAIAAHEGTHAAVARLLGAKRATYRTTPRPHVLLEFGDVPQWRVAIACIAPTIVGVVAGVGALLQFGLPELNAWAVLSATYWLLYAWPSWDDVAPMLRYLP